MLIKNLSINYDNHPSFPTSSQEWTCSQLVLDEFNEKYKNLESGYRPEDWPQLLDLIRTIFDSFFLDDNDPLEHAFISELKACAENMVSSHINFYTSCLNLNKLRIFQFEQIEKCFFQGFITPSTMAAITKSTKIDFRALKDAALHGKTDRQSLSRNSGLKIRQLIKALNREFKRNGILDQLSEIFPGSIKVVGAAVELSVPHAEWWSHSDVQIKAPKTLYAHLDEGIDAPKAIVYLSDVKESNGPFSYFPDIYEKLNLTGIQSVVGRCITNVGSHKNSVLYNAYGSSIRRTSSDLFRKHFMKLPAGLRFNSHFGWDVVSGSSLESQMIKSEVKVLGERGTFLVFDGGRTVHRGGLVEDGHRQAVQVIFGTMGLRAHLGRLKRFLLRKPRH